MANDFPYLLSEHAKQRITERGILLEWIVQTLEEPQQIEPHVTDPELRYAYRCIPERGERVLKVVYNATNDPWRIVTVYFDRKLKGKL
jgi:hypothetical protein